MSPKICIRRLRRFYPLLFYRIPLTNHAIFYTIYRQYLTFVLGDSVFYESKNSQHPDLVRTESGTDFHFPPHLHGSFELITVTEGEMLVTVDKIQYTLHPGEVLLIFPNQVHALATPEHSRHFLCIFSSRIVQAYSKIFLSKMPVSNLFRPEPFYLEKLCALQNGESFLSIKGLLYSLCAAFDSTAVYRKQTAGAEDLLIRLFHFVEQNYQKDCTLTALSREISHHPAYLSRYFKQCTGITFTQYVQEYRVNEACSILHETDRSVLQTAYDCGFDSLRSFNRNFQKITGLSPSVYRANK